MPNYRRTPLEERLWSRVVKTDGCWFWAGQTAGRGYGTIGRGGRGGGSIYVHRVAFELAYGPIPDGMFVCHTCDNPACCRNDDEGWYEVNGVLRPRRGHLWLGTCQENIDDMHAKGRSPQGDLHPSHVHADLMARGEHHGHAKLTDDAVRAIRSRYAAGGIVQRDLAKEYGVSQDAIARVIRRERWRHVE